MFISIILLGGNSLFAQTTAKVLKVVAADAIEIEEEEQIETVYLLGVDTPKVNPNASRGLSKKYIKALKEREKEALKYTKSVVKSGDVVLIDYDKRRRDNNNRVVGYVYFNNGLMLNEMIIEAGYASVSFELPNIKFQERFQKDYLEARANRKGLWK